MEKDGVALFNTATNSRLNSAESKCGVYIDGNVGFSVFSLGPLRVFIVSSFAGSLWD